jgi:hypothetical protein
MQHHPHKKQLTEAQIIRREAFKKLGLILVGILLLVNTIQLSQFGGLVERVDRYNRGVIDEVGGLRGDVVTFAGDLNEIRSFLLLPVKEYSFAEKKPETQEAGEQETSRTETALYNVLGQLAQDQNDAKNDGTVTERAATVGADKGLSETLTAEGLTLGKQENTDSAIGFKILDSGRQAVFAILLDKTSGKTLIQSVLGNEQMKSEVTQDLIKEIEDYIKANKDKVVQLKELIGKQKEGIAALGSNKDVTAVLTQKKITLGSAEETDTSIDYFVLNSDLEKLLKISIQRGDGKIEFDGKKYESADTILPDFIKKLGALDADTAMEKLIKTRRAELESVFAQETFKTMLTDGGLTISPPREAYNQIIYDVKNAKGETVISFVIEISSGLYKVIKGNEEIDLYSTVENGLKKKP